MNRAGYIYKDLVLSCDTAAYTSGDVLAAPQELVGVCLGGHPVKLESISLLDKDDQGLAMELYILRSLAPMGAENAAVAWTNVRADEILAMVPIGTANYTDLGSSQFVTRSAAAGDAGMGAICYSSGGSSLWVGAVTRGTPTHSVAGITLKLGFSDARI